jgi:hypothetical protein
MATRSLGVDDEERTARTCPICKSENQVEFPAEVNLHFRGFKNVGHPGVLFFPKVLVCLVCGQSQFTIPVAKLALLRITEDTEKQR